MSKYLLKFLNYILPSGKDWTRVGLLRYRDVYLHSTIISRENILSIELVLKSDITTTKTYKSAVSDEDILSIQEIQHRLLSLLIFSDKRIYLYQ